MDVNQDGAIDPVAEQGQYDFRELPPGSYGVREVTQAGFVQTQPQTADYRITIERAEHATRDFGSFRLAEVRGTTFFDLDEDGKPDPNEPGLGGWTIYIDTNGNNALDSSEPSTETDAAGAYTLVGLLPGTNSVREVSKPGWIQTNPLSGELSVAATSGGVIVARDFGNFAHALQFSAAEYNVSESRRTATITVTLTPPSDATATVRYETSDGTATGRARRGLLTGSDYVLAAGTLSFAPGETTKTFTVSILDDRTDEDDETIHLQLFSPTGAALSALASSTLTITDDDTTPVVRFSTTSYSVCAADDYRQ